MYVLVRLSQLKMKITVTTLNDEIFSLDVSDDLELENFKVFCEIESGIPSTEILINHNGKPLMENQQTLKALGIVDGDVVILQRMFNSSSERTNPVNPSNSRKKSGSYFSFVFVVRSLFGHGLRNSPIFTFQDR